MDEGGVAHPHEPVLHNHGNIIVNCIDDERLEISYEVSREFSYFKNIIDGECVLR